MSPRSLRPEGIFSSAIWSTTKTWLYNVAGNSWTQTTGSKVYSNDSSDEEGWAKLPSGNVVNYDLFHSISANGAYAETYNPTTQLWSSISPSDGSALGTIPQLSSVALGYELGPIIRLQDGRVLVIGATQHTGIYNPSTNTWAAGPDIMGTLTNSVNPTGTAVTFGADDAPAAIVPSGHVIFAADAGPSPVTTTGNITSGSNVITNIPSTALLQLYWSVSGTGIPGGTYITSIDSLSQVHIFANATATHAGESIAFGGTFSNPTQLLDFNDNEVAIVMGSALKYDITEMVDPQYNVVAKLPKSALAAFR